MKYWVILFIVMTTSYSWAFSGNMVGVGYITKADDTNIYSDSNGKELDEVVQKDFPLVAVDSTSVWIGGGAIASESISDGRLHVRYWKNGKDSGDGENTGWVDPKEVERFQFDCCGEANCSGIKAKIFKSRTFSDCFYQGLTVAIEKRATSTNNSSAEIEKLKLQLEIEKLKLEQERLRATVKPQQ